MKAWAFAIGGVLIYVLPAVAMKIYLTNHDLVWPWIGALLWPIRLAKLLLGGG